MLKYIVTKNLRKNYIQIVSMCCMDNEIAEEVNIAAINYHKFHKCFHNLLLIHTHQFLVK